MESTRSLTEEMLAGASIDDPSNIALLSLSPREVIRVRLAKYGGYHYLDFRVGRRMRGKKISLTGRGFVLPKRLVLQFHEAILAAAQTIESEETGRETLGASQGLDAFLRE